MNIEDFLAAILGAALVAGGGLVLLTLVLILSPWFWLAVIAYTLITKL